MYDEGAGCWLDDPTGRTSYTWDAVGRLEEVVNPAGKRVSYSYDAAGQMTETIETDGAGTTQVVYSYHPSGFGNLLHQW